MPLANQSLGRCLQLGIVTSIFMGSLLTVLPVYAQQNNSTSSFTDPLGGISLATLIGRIILFLLSLAALLALAAIIWGGLMYILSLGNESRAESAKKIIIYAIVGLLIIGAAFLIISLIRTIIS